MTPTHQKRNRVAAVAVLAFVLAATVRASALSVTVNGQLASFSPPPIERAGRVFVPLRGVFETLGASVVYQNGAINATGNSRTVSLHVGSTSATVDGQTQTLDIAPFIVGASTYVPLRFVSQALGAGVNYDATNQIVALTSGGPQAAPPEEESMVRPPEARGPILTDEHPGRAASVPAQRPTISANFAQAVDPNTVRISLDGLDITDSATRSAVGFIYAPDSPLQSMNHTVEVRGRTADGERFVRRWSFRTGSEDATTPLSLIDPSNGSVVSRTFTVAGRTAPDARVHIDAGSTSEGSPFAFRTGSYDGDTRADGEGRFSQDVTLPPAAGSSIGVAVTATDPTTQSTAEMKLHVQEQ